METQQPTAEQIFFFLCCHECGKIAAENDGDPIWYYQPGFENDKNCEANYKAVIDWLNVIAKQNG